MMNDSSYCAALRLMDRFEQIKIQTILIHNSRIKFGVPPAPTVEGREKLTASFPSIFSIIYRKIKASINEKSLKKFGPRIVPSGEEQNVPCKASLLTQSSSLGAAGSSLREFKP